MTDKDDWQLREEGYEPDRLARSESLMSLGNGYLGMRGNLEEAVPAYHRGVYINGFFETSPYVYGEKAYGFAADKQQMLNLPDGRITEVAAGAYELDVESPELIRHRRTLDLRKGLLTRESVWELPDSAAVRMETTCFVSAVRPEIAVQNIVVTVSGTPGPIRIASRFVFPSEGPGNPEDPRRGERFDHDPLLLLNHEPVESGVDLHCRTVNSGLDLRASMAHGFEKTEPSTSDTGVVTGTDGEIRGFEVIYEFSDDDHVVNLTKVMRYAGADRTGESAIEVLGAGYRELRDEHVAYWERFWERADVVIEGDDEAKRALRFGVFQLNQSAGRDGRTGVAAKGLTGEGYEGHYFWDTEVYMQPFFTYVLPETARELQRFRTRGLPAAEERAGELAQIGALYPWRTIDGREASAYFPAGTAQYHINADIFYSLLRYLRATGDEGFLFADDLAALRMIVQTARFWFDLGFFNPRKGGQFCIHEVTGPDEYSALVNDNFYTNVMAAHHLGEAARIVDETARNHPERFTRLEVLTGLGYDETALWKKASDNIYLPFDEEAGIFAQDDGFLDRKPWDLSLSRRAGKHPLLLYFHPLVIYRHQVIKQADVVLAFFMRPHLFDESVMRRSFDYYEKLTTGDSSLSGCIQGLVASRLGYKAQAYRYFKETAYLDFHDLHGNVKDGLHMAAAGGMWLITVFGFGGFDDTGDRPRFDPELPRGWERLAFDLRMNGGVLSVSIIPGKTNFLWKGEKPLAISYRDRPVVLAPNESTELEDENSASSGEG